MINNKEWNFRLTCPTTSTARMYHRRLWHWLSMNVGARKKDWPEWKFNGGAVTDFDTRCFACGESKTLDNGKYIGCSDFCPVYDCCLRESVHALWKDLTRRIQNGIEDHEDYIATVVSIKLLAEEMRDAWK